MTAKDHGRLVLAGLFPNRLDLLEELRRHVTADYFTDSVQQAIFKFVGKYFEMSGGGLLTRSGLDDILDRLGWDAGRRALYEETYDDLVETKVDDTDFTWALNELREDFAESNVRDALTKSMEIVVQGIEQKDGEVLKGQEAAREYVLERMTNLDLAMRREETPHGDVRDEYDLILNEYTERKIARAENRLAGVRFGITELDQKVGGLQPGELVLSAGYSSDGKTSLCVQLAWSAAVEQGKNVLFLSTETVNTVIRRKIVARHSRHSLFSELGHPEGLNSKNLKDGSLTEAEEEFLQIVVGDLTTNKDYGRLYIHQVPRMASMEVVEQIMLSIQRKFNIDLVVCDYLALLRPLGVRATDRESLSGILKNGKQICTTFNKGNGVPFISPWQVNRAARDSALSIGMYTSASLAETAEATNTPDVIVSLLAPEDNTSRYADLTAQVLKNRDGETANGLQIEVDYATSMFRSKSGFTSFAQQASAATTTGMTDAQNVFGSDDIPF